MQRLLEPSTWAGFAILAQAIAPFLPPTWSAIAGAIVAAGGAGSIALREKGVQLP